MQSIAIYIEHAIMQWGAVGVFLGSVLEEIIVPIPSSLVQAGAGIFFLAGQPFSITALIKLVTWIAIPAALGVTVGSLPIYFLTYYGGMPAIRKFGKFFFLDAEKVEKARENIVTKKNTFFIITAFRFIPLLPNSLVTASAGLLRMPFLKFLISTLLGVFIRALYLGIIGWTTGTVTGAESKSLYEKIAILVGVLVVLSILITLIFRYVHTNQKNKSI